VNPAAWKDPSLQKDANKDYVGSPADIKSSTDYLANTQKLIDRSESKGVDWGGALPIGQYITAQRSYEVEDSTIRGALNTIGINGDNIKGIPADRLMRPWMLSSEYFDFGSKPPKQLKPSPPREPEAPKARGSRASSELESDPDKRAIGVVHANTVRMNQVARSIMMLSEGSPNRQKAIEEYKKLRDEATKARNSLKDKEWRKLANFDLRTVIKPYDNTGTTIPLD
jgi:hypothetical protein